MNLPSPANWSILAVLADELEQQGDPQAELIRAQLAGLEGQELIAQHWSEWVGALDPAQTLLTWEGGHIREAALNVTPPGWSVDDLLRRPTAYILQRLAIGPRAEISWGGTRETTALLDVVWLTGRPAELARTRWPRLEFLKLDLQANTDPASLKTLCSADMPRLRALHTRCVAAHEVPLARAVSKAPWWSTLEAWTHHVQSLEGLMAVARCAHLQTSGGRGFIAYCEASVLAQVPNAVRRVLPHAEFRLKAVPHDRGDSYNFHHPAQISVTPHHAPTHFRTLPPRTDTARSSPQNSGSKDHLYVGSGVPFATLSWPARQFCLCGWCGSAETRCIYEDASSLYSDFETTYYTSWEYECLHCGLFTHARNGTT